MHEIVLREYCNSLRYILKFTWLSALTAFLLLCVSFATTSTSKLRAHNQSHRYSSNLKFKLNVSVYIKVKLDRVLVVLAHPHSVKEKHG